LHTLSLNSVECNSSLAVQPNRAEIVYPGNLAQRCFSVLEKTKLANLGKNNVKYANSEMLFTYTPLSF